MYVTIKEAIIINVFILDNQMIRDFYSMYTSKERQTSIKYNSLFTSTFYKNNCDLLHLRNFGYLFHCKYEILRKDVQ